MAVLYTFLLFCTGDAVHVIDAQISAVPKNSWFSKTAGRGRRLGKQSQQLLICRWSGQPILLYTRKVFGGPVQRNASESLFADWIE